MAKIADELDRALSERMLRGAVGRTRGRLLAHGDGWAVEDVICTSGPEDRPFEEQHSQIAIAIVAAGTFQYRATTGRALMTPGSVMLGNPGHCFECGHEHGRGDRCIAFRFTPEYFERIAADVGISTHSLAISAPHLPAIRDSASIVADACTGLVAASEVSWEEIGVRLAACVARLATSRPRRLTEWTPNAAARVTRVVRAIDRKPASRLTLACMAELAGLSRYHFLRTFELLTGLTPHQYVRRSRLREAAMRLAAARTKVIDVAYDSGFGDVSNFNRAFRTEFGVSPLAHRARAAGLATPAARLEIR